LVFLLFKGKLIKHANHRMRQEAVGDAGTFDSGVPHGPPYIVDATVLRDSYKGLPERAAARSLLALMSF
jgi:hypothetical protein